MTVKRNEKITDKNSNLIYELKNGKRLTQLVKKYKLIIEAQYSNNEKIGKGTSYDNNCIFLFKRDYSIILNIC